jgi:cephalosporin hydroxylase
VVVDAFHRLYYENSKQTWRNTRWLGVSVLKCPLDLWVYQELLTELRPDLVIETGTRFGGSALYLASIMDLLGQGQVVTVDCDWQEGLPDHPRIEYLLGSSVSEEILDQMQQRTYGKSTVMVLLDSAHDQNHVLRELHCYAPLVTKGSYLIVEDTSINGHPVLPDFGPGPAEAVDDFLATTRAFVRDPRREKYLMTFNPSGYLRRVRAGGDC